MQELKEICTQWASQKEIHEGFTCSVDQVPVVGNPCAIPEIFVDFINKDGGYTITVKMHVDESTTRRGDERPVQIKAELQCSSTTGYDAVLAYAELPQEENAVSELLDHVHQCLRGNRGGSKVFSDIKKFFLANADGKINVEPCRVVGLPANNNGGLKTYSGDAASTQLIVEDVLWAHNSCMRRNDTKMFVDPWTGTVFAKVSPKEWDEDKSPRPVLMMRISEYEEGNGGKAVHVDAAVKNTSGVGISNATQVEVPKQTGHVYSIVHDMVKLFNKAVCIAVNDDDEGTDVAAVIAEYIGMKSRAHFVALTRKSATVRITNANVLFGTIQGELFTSFAMRKNASFEHHQVENWIQEIILKSGTKTARIQAVPCKSSIGRVFLRNDYSIIADPTVKNVQRFVKETLDFLSRQ
jgi:hypothetical protein